VIIPKPRFPLSRLGVAKSSRAPIAAFTATSHRFSAFRVFIHWDDLNFGKIYDMLKICPKFGRVPVKEFLPIAQTQPRLQYVLYIANNSGT